MPTTDLQQEMLKALSLNLEDTPEAPEGSMKEFIEQALGTRLWAMQAEIADALETSRRVTVRSCHGAGKSYMAARFVLAFLYTHPHSTVVTTAPTDRQVEHVLWRYIRSARRSALRELQGRYTLKKVDIEEDWFSIGFKGTDENVDAFQGFHSENMLVVVDEAAGVAETILQGLGAILTGSNSHMLMIGNPTSTSGGFRDSFGRNADLYTRFKISAYDTPNFTEFGITRQDMLNGSWRKKITGPVPYPGLVDPEWVNDHIMLHGEDSAWIQSRVDAEFPTESGDVLISINKIETAMENRGNFPPTEEDGFIVGVDVARGGGDETVCVLRRGDEEIDMQAWSMMDTMQTTAMIRHFVHERNGLEMSDVEIRVDMNGVGSGVYDRLIELGYNAIDINWSYASSDPEKWMTCKHEYYWQLRMRYYNGRIAGSVDHQLDDVMVSQLSDIRFSWNSKYTMPVIEKKEDAKRRGAKSPDRAEAQVIAFADLAGGGGITGTRALAGRARRTKYASRSSYA